MFQAPIRAVLLDLDGTLYAQTPLRCLMAMELACLPIQRLSWKEASATIKMLKCFRKTREELRQLGYTPGQPLAELQYRLAGERGGVSPLEVQKIVMEWMYQRPLKYLKLCRRNGVKGFLESAKQRNVQIGVFSDYPAHEKLEALGLAKWVKLILCSTDKDINAFKPHPRGYLRACEYWRLKPEEVLYVGDRSEVDAEGAKAAGMPCMILNGSTNLEKTQDAEQFFYRLTSFQGLQHVLSTHC